MNWLQEERQLGFWSDCSGKSSLAVRQRPLRSLLEYLELVVYWGDSELNVLYSW